MEKIIIHRITITQATEKHLFQIPLPDGATAVTGVAATTDKVKVLSGDVPVPNKQVGLLRLFIADTGDKFFAEPLHAVYEPPRQEILGEDFTLPTLYNGVKFFELLDTWLPSDTTVINGYYLDMNAIVIGGGGKTGGTIFPYNVQVYLRLQIDES